MAEAFLMSQSGGGDKILGTTTVNARSTSSFEEGELVAVFAENNFSNTTQKLNSSGLNNVDVVVQTSPKGEKFFGLTGNYVRRYSVGNDSTLNFENSSYTFSGANTFGVSNSGQRAFVGSATSTNFNAYMLTVDNFVFKTGEVSNPAFAGVLCGEFSDNDKFFVTGGTSTTSSKLTHYRLEGNTLQYYTAPFNIPGDVKSVSFTTDNKYLLVGHEGGPYLTIYEINGNNFTKVADSVILPTGKVNAIKTMEHSKKVITGHDNAPFLSTFSRVNGVLVKIPDVSNSPITTPVTDVSVSPCGSEFLVKQQGNETTLYRFRFEGDTLIYIGAIQSTGAIVRPIYSNDGKHIFATKSVAPLGVQTFTADSNNSLYKVVKYDGDQSLLEKKGFVSLGYMLGDANFENNNTGAKVKVKLLPI